MALEFLWSIEVSAAEQQGYGVWDKNMEFWTVQTSNLTNQEQRPTRCGLRWKVTSRRRKIAHHVPISSHPPSEGIFIGHGESPGLAEYEQSSNVTCAVVVHEDLFGTILENNMTHPDTTFFYFEF